MKLSKNESNILKLLISSQDYITTYDIATSTGINRRVVREEMVRVKQILESLNLSLISKPSKGYLIETKSTETISFIHQLINESKKEKETLFPTLPHDRQDYIQKRLIDAQDYIKIDTLADELLISRSTISNDIAAIRKGIKKYNLFIKQKPNYGICICGNEMDQRKVLADHLFTKLNKSEMFYAFIDSYTNSDDYQIIQYIKDYKIEMSDIGLNDFLLCLSIFIMRGLQCHPILEPALEFEGFINRSEYQVALKISEFVYQKFQLKFNEYEIQHIALLLICKRSTKGLAPTSNTYAIQISQCIIQEIKKQTLILIENERLHHSLPLYVESALIRQKYNEKIRNPLYEDIKLAYPLAYELALIASSVIEKFSNHQLSSSELASFATLFNNAIHNQRYQKKRVLLLNALGYSSENLCNFLINENFSNRLVVTKTIQYYKLNEENLSQYDLIITPIPIHKDLPIPCIQVTYMINQDDINRINNHISYLFNNQNLVYYFHPKLFTNHSKVKNKKGAITLFYQLLQNCYPVLKETFKTNMMNKSYYTLKVFADFVGVIRLNKPISWQNLISVIMLDQPIVWDNETLQIIILFACPDTDNIMYNTLYNTFVHLSEDQEALAEILNHPEYTRFLEIIQKHK